LFLTEEGNVLYKSISLLMGGKDCCKGRLEAATTSEIMGIFDQGN